MPHVIRKHGMRASVARQHAAEAKRQHCWRARARHWLLLVIIVTRDTSQLSMGVLKDLAPANMAVASTQRSGSVKTHAHGLCASAARPRPRNVRRVSIQEKLNNVVASTRVPRIYMTCEVSKCEISWLKLSAAINMSARDVQRGKREGRSRPWAYAPGEQKSTLPFLVDASMVHTPRYMRARTVHVDDLRGNPAAQRLVEGLGAQECNCERINAWRHARA